MIRRPTWVLLAIFIVLLVVLFVWQRSQTNISGNATPTAGVELLIDSQENEIVRFRISNLDGNSVEVVKAEDDLWTLVEPGGKSTDTDRVESGITRIESLRVISGLETDLDKSSIGLDPVEYELEVEFRDGETTVLFIGKSTPTGGYYAYIEGEPLVVVDSFGIDNLLELLSDPPVLKTPTPSPPP